MIKDSWLLPIMSSYAFEKYFSLLERSIQKGTDLIQISPSTKLIGSYSFFLMDESSLKENIVLPLCT